MSERDPGVQLGHYLDDHPEVDVALSCPSCGRGRALPMAGVVQRLTALGRDPRTTGIREIAELVKAPCSCGACKWESGPRWPAPAMGADAEQARAGRVGEMNHRGRELPGCERALRPRNEKSPAGPLARSDGARLLRGGVAES